MHKVIWRGGAYIKGPAMPTCSLAVSYAAVVDIPAPPHTQSAGRPQPGME
jgi:hypothetical protein